MFPYEMNKSRKFMLEIGKIGPSDFRNWTIQFRQDQRQPRASSGFDKGLLLRPSGVWTVERLEP
jgi:hypothetical protein